MQQHIAYIELSRGDRMNAQNARCISFGDTKIRDDKSIRVVAISGQGDNFVLVSISLVLPMRSSHKPIRMI